MTSPCYDVAIVGGGPAGCATALSLRSHEPSLSVIIIEASAYEPPRLGETLPPPARRLLDHLGVWEAFQRQGHREVYGTAAVWGSVGLHEHDFIYTPRDTGWHLDRAAFDAMLARAAPGALAFPTAPTSGRASSSMRPAALPSSADGTTLASSVPIA